MSTLPTSRLLSSFTYPAFARSWIPDRGDARWHINLWHINGNGQPPQGGLRVHAITQVSVRLHFRAEKYR
jgi:hypothetical protein